MKYMMDERPDLNEKLMEFYCYLLDMKSIHDFPLENKVEFSDDTSYEGVDMSLDEMIWNLGMTCPSWNN